MPRWWLYPFQARPTTTDFYFRTIYGDFTPSRPGHAFMEENRNFRSSERIRERYHPTEDEVAVIRRHYHSEDPCFPPWPRIQAELIRRGHAPAEIVGLNAAGIVALLDRTAKARGGKRSNREVDAAKATHTPDKEAPVWQRLVLEHSTDGSDHSAVFNGQRIKVRGEAAFIMLKLLNEKEGGRIKGESLKATIGRPPNQVYASLAEPLQRIIDKPGQGGTGYAMREETRPVPTRHRKPSPTSRERRRQR
jgi:hypothetical protein